MAMANGKTPNMNDVYRRVGELKGSVDALRRDISNPESGLVARAQDNERRIRSLEKSRAKLWGAAGLLAAAASFVGWDAAANYFQNL